MVLEFIREYDAPVCRYLNWNFSKLIKNKISHLEIGFGNGDYIVSFAKAYPKEVFFGIEYNPKYYRKGLKKTYNLVNKNIFLFCTEAKSFLWHAIPDNVFNFVHINFPDPWPKKRHIRRRLVDNDFVQELYRVLKPDGLIFLATDYYEYFLNIVSLFERNSFLKIYISDKPYDSRIFKTKYEKTFESLSIPIFYSILKKNVDKHLLVK